MTQANHRHFSAAARLSASCTGTNLLTYLHTPNAHLRPLMSCFVSKPQRIKGDCRRKLGLNLELFITVQLGCQSTRHTVNSSQPKSYDELTGG